MTSDPFDKDPFRRRDKRERRRFGMLEFDAWLDSTMYWLGDSGLRAWDSFRVFMDRFGLSGIKRFVVELVSDGFRRHLPRPLRQRHRQARRAAGRYGRARGPPDNLIKAVLATEDRRFFEHFGIDILGTVRAVQENARAGGVVQGGSSITQQLAKNLFLSNERTLQRKIKEAYLALWLEANLSKREILKLYLDRAYMGGGTFGVGAASEFYFGKKVQDLDLAECAILAGLFKAPTKYAPHVNLPAARAPRQRGAHQHGAGRLHDRGPGDRRAAPSGRAGRAEPGG